MFYCTGKNGQTRDLPLPYLNPAGEPDLLWHILFNRLYYNLIKVESINGSFPGKYVAKLNEKVIGVLELQHNKLKKPKKSVSEVQWRILKSSLGLLGAIKSGILLDLAFNKTTKFVEDYLIDIPPSIIKNGSIRNAVLKSIDPQQLAKDFNAAAMAVDNYYRLCIFFFEPIMEESTVLLNKLSALENQ